AGTSGGRPRPWPLGPAARRRGVPSPHRPAGPPWERAGRDLTRRAGSERRVVRKVRALAVELGDPAGVVAAVAVPARRGPHEGARAEVLELKGAGGLDTVVPRALRRDVLGARDTAVLPRLDVVELAAAGRGGA